MPKYKISWGWDGTEEGEEIIEADDLEDAQGESFMRLHEMQNERGFHRAKLIEE